MADIKTRIISVVGTEEPVTLSEAKNYLRVSNTQDDNKITSLIKAARTVAENYISRDIISREREMFIVGLDGEETVELLYAPINSSEDLTVTIDGAETTEGSEWEKVGITNDPYLVFNDSYARKVSITYTTEGMASNDDIKQGVLAILYCLYEDEPIKSSCFAILTPSKRIYV